jgi:hypothetical protein
MARLLDAGAEPDALVAARDADGPVEYTALLAAAGAGQLEAVRLLLDRGADPRLAGSEGGTALMQAAGRGHAGVVRELAARGADLDGRPENGATAFHCACVRNEPECVAALVELGCDTTIKAKNGRTGKQLAEQRGHAVVLERLRLTTGRRRELEAKRAAASQREEVGRLIARQAFGVAAPLLARMLRDSPADPGLVAWQAEVAAGHAEAEIAAEANAANHRAAEAAKRRLRVAAEEREARKAADQAAAEAAVEATAVAQAAAAATEALRRKAEVELPAFVASLYASDQGIGAKAVMRALAERGGWGGVVKKAAAQDALQRLRGGAAEEDAAAAARAHEAREAAAAVAEALRREAKAELPGFVATLWGANKVVGSKAAMRALAERGGWGGVVKKAAVQDALHGLRNGAALRQLEAAKSLADPSETGLIHR